MSRVCATFAGTNPACIMKKLTILLFLSLSLPAFSASVIRQAKEAIKKKQNLEATAKTLLEEAAKPETRHAKRVECYVLAAECWNRVYEAENMKLYLHQKYDTVKFFNSIQQMYQLLEKADSIEAEPNEKGKVRIRNRRGSRDMLMPFRKNLYAGGSWFFRKAQMPEALTYFQTYIDAAESPIFAAENFHHTDTLMPYVAYLAVHAANMSQNHDAVIKYAPLALQSNIRNHIVQEYLSKAWAAKGDTTHYLEAMWEGLRTYPQYTYFYSNLIDHLIEERNYERGLSVTDSMITWSDTIPLFHYAKSLLLLKLHRDEEAIKAADDCLALDSNYVDALYNKGIASLNLAVIFSETACTDPSNPQSIHDRQIIRSLYELARKPMERVRQLQPETTDRWAPLLYRIYLNLNMGKEFDEMDHILNG